MIALLLALACSSAPPVVQEGDQLVVRGDRIEVAYAPGSPGEIAGRVLSLEPGIDELGVARVLIYVADDDFVRGKSLEAQGTCPANYWNTHMKIAGFVTPDDRVQDVLGGVNLVEGDRVTITGSWLTVARSELNGQDFPVRGQIRYFHPDRVLLANRSK